MHIFTLHRVLKEPRSLATLRARASTRGFYCCVGFSEQERLRREEGQRPLQAEEILAPHPPWNTHRQTDRQMGYFPTFSTVNVHAELTQSLIACWGCSLLTSIDSSVSLADILTRRQTAAGSGFSSSFSPSVRHCRGVSEWTRLLFFSSPPPVADLKHSVHSGMEYCPTLLSFMIRGLSSLFNRLRFAFAFPFQTRSGYSEETTQPSRPHCIVFGARKTSSLLGTKDLPRLRPLRLPVKWKWKKTTRTADWRARASYLYVPAHEGRRRAAQQLWREQ